MGMIKMLRVILMSGAITMLAQTAFAGRMLGGDDRSVDFHEFTAKVCRHICPRMGQSSQIGAGQYCSETWNEGHRSRFAGTG